MLGTLLLCYNRCSAEVLLRIGEVLASPAAMIHGFIEQALKEARERN
jgi:hypothetical protein